MKGLLSEALLRMRTELVLPVHRTHHMSYTLHSITGSYKGLYSGLLERLTNNVGYGSGTGTLQEAACGQ